MTTNPCIALINYKHMDVYVVYHETGIGYLSLLYTVKLTSAQTQAINKGQRSAALIVYPKPYPVVIKPNSYYSSVLKDKKGDKISSIYYPLAPD